MFRVSLLAIGLATAGLLDPAFAQTTIAPAPPYYALSPAPNGQSPVQQQIQENYRSQLLQTQREMLQQNPSGLGREQLEINHQLNMYNAPPPVTYNAPPPARSPAAPAAYYATPPAADYGAPPATRHAARRPAPRHGAPDPPASR
jgi:hypothetical protein